MRIGDRVTVHPRKEWNVTFRKSVEGKKATVLDIAVRVPSGVSLVRVVLDRRPVNCGTIPTKYWWFLLDEVRPLQLDSGIVPTMHSAHSALAASAGE